MRSVRIVLACSIALAAAAGWPAGAPVAQVAAQSAQIGVAKSDLYPAFSLVGTIGWVGSTVGQSTLGASSLAISAGPAVQWNFLNYGQITNNVRAQDAKFQELLVDYQNTVLKAQQEVENGITEFSQSRAEVVFLQASVEAAIGAADDARLLVRRDRPGGVVETLARFDFRKHQEPAAPRHDVDLAQRRTPAPRRNPEPFRDQERGGAAFCRQPEPERGDALRLGGKPRQPRRPARRQQAVVVTPARHRRMPPARARVDRFRGEAGR